jgi:hypothetical protein
MANVENEELNETELFNQSVSDEPVETTETPVVEAEQDQAAAETDQEATAEATAEKPPIPPKPEWRLREDAERARAAEAELANERAEKAALRQRLEALERPAPKTEATKPTRPDPLLDPDGYAAAIRQELREEVLNERREESLQQAAEADPENFKAAYALAQQRVDPALKARMQESRNPGKTLLTWYREQKTVQEVGNDPSAWLESKLAERLKDPAFLAKAVEAAQNSARQPPQQTNGRPRVELPPSLSSASRSNAAARTDNTDVSDSELFRETTG